MSAATLAQMLGSLMLVLLLILLCAALLRRLPGAAMAGSALKLRGSLSLGVRERVVLVEAGDKILVLGVAPGRISTLHVLDEWPDAPPAETSFSALLKRSS